MAWARHLPLLLLAGVFIWALVTVNARSVEQAPPGTTVLRIGHWQLEASVRDAFRILGDEFSNLPEIRAKFGKVKVIQDAIPEGVYGQWITSQMMGQTAPDLVEIGVGLPPTIWLAYQNRYFEPLTVMAGEPNPYNKGTPLEGVPLQNTFVDGMRTGYTEELQEFMRAPLSRTSQRLFYNADLLEKLTGSRTPPKTYRQLLAACEQIAAQKTPAGKVYVPIASSAYNITLWEGGLFDPLTYTNLFSADFNRDGTIGNDEFFAAFKAGRLTFDSPGVKAKFLVTAEVKKFFQNGFTGLGRDDAVFLFAQERAVFITAGTWDAQSLKEQAGGRFDIRLTDFPLPSRDDPEFGPLILGPKYDAGNTGFPFGLYRFSKQPELAREFLLFLSSFEGNRKLNSIIGWPPAIRGLPMPEVLEGFNPQNQGMYSCFNFNLGGETYVRWMQNYSLFKSDPTFTYQDLARDFGPFYLEKGLKDWREQQRDWRRAILRNERFLAGSRGSAIMEAPADPLNTAWVKYRAYTTARQVTPEITRATQVRMVTSGPARQVGPYDYLPEARQRILEDAAKTPPATNPVKPAGESATSGETQQQPKNNPSGAPERSGRAAQ